MKGISLKSLTDKHQWTVRLRAFRMWQRRPYEVAPLSEKEHTCASCKTEFTGNHCPRCGQRAEVGRFSFKKALLLFIDVWGIGNRGMFRSIRDLMLRPGYMIRDYLSGMQSAYFPPFKMFFLLTALSLVVEHGIHLMPSTQEQQIEVVENTKVKAADISEEAKKGARLLKIMDALEEKYPAVFALIVLVIFTVPLYFFMRTSPTIPDLRYSEFLVALVYTSNTFSIYSIIGSLLHLEIIDVIAVIMVFVALHQFSGFSKRRVFRHILLTVLISALVFIIGIAIIVYIAHLLGYGHFST